MILVSDEALDIPALMERLPKEGAGSVVIHLGVVKPDPEGRRSEGIVFRDRGGLQEELETMESELRERFTMIGFLAARRLGELKVGETILFVGVSAKDRETAFSACREAVERMKKLKNLEKKERWTD